MTARTTAIDTIANHRVASTQNYLEHAGADIYGQYVFHEDAQRQYLAKPIFRKLRRTIDGHEPFDPAIVDAVAHGVKEWAMAHGATHYTHWFVPMTGSTAEKHDSFLNPTGDGRTIAEFSGKNLLQGEPDASSFPSGGIRATFEARGYTAWDVTSPIFLQVEPNGVTLTIPTAYVSFTGEALDHKIPLLRSQEALGKQALRVLRWFGNASAKRVFTNIGPEQEYFLVDRRLAEQRPDLVLTGRTLFGAPSPKGQELEDQYFGSIRERILAFMMDLDRELWRLGHPVQDPPQRGGARPVRDGAGLRAHVGRLRPQHARDGDDAEARPAARPDVPHPREAVRRHQRLRQAQQLVDGDRRRARTCSTRATTRTPTRSSSPSCSPSSAASTSTRTSSGRASRTPARTTAWAPTRRRRRSCRSSSARSSRTSSPSWSRAPRPRPSRADPSTLGVTSLPDLPKDATDRNRTSPFAFTGNKFEFRAVGSSAPIYWPQTVLNTAVADSLKPARRRAGRARRRRLRRPDHDPVRHRTRPQAGPVRGQRLLRGVARRGRPARACPTTGPPSMRCRRSPRTRPLRCSAASASCPSASSRPARTSTGSATSRSRTSRPTARWTSRGR